MLDQAGETVWINNRGRVTERSADGKPLRASGLTSDITDRKELEDQLEDSERLLREAMDGAQYGAWSLHLPSGTVRVSGFAQQLMGSKDARESVPISAFLELLSPPYTTQAETDLERLRDGLSLQAEYELIDRDGNWM